MLIIAAALVLAQSTPALAYLKFGVPSARALKADDIAGISDLYPDGDFNTTAGSLSGRITKDGQPIFGAHVIAFNAATGLMVGGFTLNAQGQFSVGGLSPGLHVLRVEPIDDAEVESFFDMAGGGYFRQLHNRATLVETGRFYQFGGGATYLPVSGRHFHTNGIGARVDVRALTRSKGIAFDGGAHTSPAFGVSAFVRF